MHTPRPRQTVLAAIVALLLLLTGCTSSRMAPRPSAALLSDRALLIRYDGRSATPAYLAAGDAAWGAGPFDGVTIVLPGLTDSTISGLGSTEDAYQSALAPLPRPTRPEHNFVLLRMDARELALSDDYLWGTIISNVHALGAAAKGRPGLDGFFLDTEYYGDGANPWTSSAGTELATRRGSDLATALASSWPGATLLTTYGPWIGDRATARQGFPGLHYNDLSRSARLMGPFLAGAAAACGRLGAHYVDGGELYRLRTAADFQQAYDWMKTGLAATEPSLMPPGLAARYPSQTSIAFGVYDGDTSKRGYPTLSVATWRAVVTAALRRTDRYVWVYSDRYNWLATEGSPGAPPPELVKATAQAREDAGR